MLDSFNYISHEMEPQKVGQELGEVRSVLPLDKLVPYLEKHVVGYNGPLEVKQFKFGQVSRCCSCYFGVGLKLYSLILHTF